MNYDSKNQHIQTPNRAQRREKERLLRAALARADELRREELRKPLRQRMIEAGVIHPKNEQQGVRG